MKSKDEIKSILERKSEKRVCAYCGENIRRGYYAEDGIGRWLSFPKFITKRFTNSVSEILIHYRCVEPLIFDMLEAGGDDLDETRDNTKVLVRY